MALRDLPYLPLYVQDYLTDERLNRCTAASQGIYIKMMCVFHKSDPYGGILLKQKDKQNESTSLNFAYVFAKLLPFELLEIHNAILELLEDKVLRINGDFLFQKRMVEDNKLSEIRSLAGKKGGKKTQSKTEYFANDFALAKSEANTEDEYEDVNNISFSKEDIERIYKKYPTKCIVSGRSTGKGEKNKEKICKLLKNHSADDLISRIDVYVFDCKKTNTYLKNFATFLNNLPELEEAEKQEETFRWRWDGQPEKSGTKEEMFRDLNRMKGGISFFEQTFPEKTMLYKA